jgi:hypothetical protein
VAQAAGGRRAGPLSHKSQAGGAGGRRPPSRAPPPRNRDPERPVGARFVSCAYAGLPLSACWAPRWGQSPRSRAVAPAGPELSQRAPSTPPPPAPPPSSRPPPPAPPVRHRLAKRPRRAPRGFPAPRPPATGATATTGGPWSGAGSTAAAHRPTLPGATSRRRRGVKRAGTAQPDRRARRRPAHRLPPARPARPAPCTCARARRPPPLRRAPRRPVLRRAVPP